MVFRLIVCILMLVSSPLILAANSSLDCQSLPVPDMTRFELEITMNEAYEDVSLGRGVTYQGGDGGPGTMLFSIYMYDLGQTTISSEFEDQMLRFAYQDILDMKSDRKFGQAWKIPDALYAGMEGFLSRGVYIYAINPNNEKSPLPEMHLVSIGQYKDCVIKIRATVQASSLEDDDKVQSLKLYRAISRRLQQQVQGDDWTGPKD
jgi:hypothetical protein